MGLEQGIEKVRFRRIGDDPHLFEGVPVEKLQALGWRYHFHCPAVDQALSEAKADQRGAPPLSSLRDAFVLRLRDIAAEHSAHHSPYSETMDRARKKLADSREVAFTISEDFEVEIIDTDLELGRMILRNTLETRGGKEIDVDHPRLKQHLTAGERIPLRLATVGEKYCPHATISVPEALERLTPINFMDPYTPEYWQARNHGYQRKVYSIDPRLWPADDGEAVHTSPGIAELIAVARQFELDRPVLLCDHPLRLPNALGLSHSTLPLFVTLATRRQIAFIGINRQDITQFEWGGDYAWLVRAPRYHTKYEKEVLLRLQAEQEAEKARHRAEQKAAQRRQEAALNLTEVNEMGLGFLMPGAMDLKDVEETIKGFNEIPDSKNTPLTTDTLPVQGGELNAIRYEQDIDFPTAVQDLIRWNDYNYPTIDEFLRLLREYDLTGERVVLMRAVRDGMNNFHVLIFEDGTLKTSKINPKNTPSFPAGTIFLVKTNSQERGVAQG